MAERRILYATAFLRALTTSLIGVLLGVYLARNDVTGAAFGAVVSAGLSARRWQPSQRLFWAIASGAGGSC